MRRLVAVAGALAAVVIGAGPLVVGTAWAQTKAQRSETASRRVRAALRQELFGQDADRNTLLDMALEAVPEFAPALWHSGHVRLHNKWVRFDVLPEQTSQDRKLTAYRLQRQTSPDTVEGHLAMAKWCVKENLAPQQRAHLTKVLAMDPNNAEAHRLLGDRQVGGEWLSSEEMAEAARRAEKAAKALAEWKPAIEEIRNGLDQRGMLRRSGAAERLTAIVDPAAIGAMEALLARHSEPAARVMVQALSGMTAPEASLALARLAVFSRWETVRRAAAESLRERDVHSFIPAMLASMSAQIQSRMMLYEPPDGRIACRHVFFRQDQDRDHLTVLQTDYRRPGSSPRPLDALDRRDLAPDAARRAQALEMEKARQNAAIEQFNQRAIWVLSEATGQSWQTPEEWWRWWNDYNEVFLLDPRPVDTVYRQQDVFLVTTSEGTTSGGTPSVAECLVAGTPVWTDSGPLPVEKIQVGDVVLSQDVATGQLAYKPVLRTTTRPAGPLVRIQAGESVIQASGGHPFWVAGKGWVKARKLQPRSHLHGATGTARVDSVVQTGFEKTYNLIVADFHTYFVGPARVLSHDNTVRKPTEVLVPGLARRD